MRRRFYARLKDDVLHYNEIIITKGTIVEIEEEPPYMSIIRTNGFFLYMTPSKLSDMLEALE